MSTSSTISRKDNNGESHDSYGATLFDPRWQAKQKEILDRDGHQCVICKGTNGLQVHHRQYHFSRKLTVFNNPWDYDNNLLITLCKSCHQKGHRLYKVPVKQI